jgi:hypothetical protein
MASTWLLQIHILAATFNQTISEQQVVRFAFGGLCLVWFFLRICRIGTARFRVALFFILAIGGGLLSQAGLLPSKKPYAKTVVPQAVKNGPSAKK